MLLEHSMILLLSILIDFNSWITELKVKLKSREKRL